MHMSASTSVAALALVATSKSATGVPQPAQQVRD
jgi:hypothetical protein